MADFLYERAPLVEVIAEVRWALTQLSALPGAKIDPFFKTLAPAFEKQAEAAGFSYLEDLVPAQVPLELVGGQPTRRYRHGIGSWPLFQIGPGVLTANIVPPYQGWNVFKGHLTRGLELLENSFPAYDVQFEVDSLHLRYIDAFDFSFGFEGDVHSFLQNFLGITISVPSGVTSPLNIDGPLSVAGEISLNLTSDVKIIIKFSIGSSNNVPAMILELAASQSARIPQNEILRWFDDAHIALHSTFDGLTTGRLQSLMGSKIPVRNTN